MAEAKSSAQQLFEIIEELAKQIEDQSDIKP